MRRLGGPIPEALAPFHRGTEGPERILCEFEEKEADTFVAALLGAWPAFRVDHPGWLRERLQRRLDELWKANAVAPESVPPDVPPDVPPGGDGATELDGPGATRHVVPAVVVSGGAATEDTGEESESMTTASREKKSVRIEARLQPGWTSFSGALEGVLRPAGMIDPGMDASTLMCLTGRAFHLALDETLWPGCPTAYDWQREHVDGLARAGVFAEAAFMMPDNAAFEPAQRRAVTHIKASLDRGVGAVLWGVDVPEFGVVYGYDEADGALLVDGVARMNGGSSTPILYENVGKQADVPMLHYVTPVERIASWNVANAHRAALRDYVTRMERRAEPGAKQMVGLQAYEAWLAVLESGKYVPFGLRYNTVVYADSKKHTARYLEKAAAEISGLGEAAAGAMRTAAAYDQMLEVLGMDGPAGGAHLGQPATEAQAKTLLPLVKEAQQAEMRQVELVKRALNG